jgi:hypothetical protein
VAALDDKLEELEAKALALVAGDWLDAIDKLEVLLAAEPDSVKSRILRLLAPKIDEAGAVGALVEAFDLGRADTVEDIGASKRKTRRAISTMKPDPDTLAIVGGIASSAREAVRKAKALASTDAPVSMMLAPLLASRTEIKRNVVTGIHAASNEAITGAATAAGFPLVWVSERDACVDCLAYSGTVSETGQFPTGQTFGSKPIKKPGKKTSCPLHPNCRCRLRALRDPSFATSLKREAERSVLRGFSLPNESEKRRLDAASRLLADGVNAPASVKAYAAKAVKAGEFPTRRVPSE